MKIFIAITSDISVKTFYLDYLRFLNSRGLDVVLASNFRDELSISQVEETGTTVSQIPFVREPNLRADFKALKATYRSIKTTRPDIVIYATPKASLVTSIAAYFARVPKRIYQLWGLRLETGRGIMKFVLVASEKVIFWLSTEVISVSQSLSSRANELKLGKNPLVIGFGSSHGVNLDKYHPHKEQFTTPPDYSTIRKINPQTHFVTLIARLSRDKGVDTFIEAIRFLRIDSPDIIGVLVGDLEDSTISDEISLAISEGLVIHVPHTNDVRPYLVHASINCLPSLREGLPNVVLEASAMGIPSVVTSATGCVDAVVNNETGLVVPISSHVELARAIKKLVEDSPLRARMSANGVKYVQERYLDTFVYEQNVDHITN